MKGGELLAAYGLWLHCNQDNEDATIAHCNNDRCNVGGSSRTIQAANVMMLAFNLHMSMGKIHWREEGDPIINGMNIGDIFYV